jgi:hypothetical protein
MLLQKMIISDQIMKPILLLTTPGIDTIASWHDYKSVSPTLYLNSPAAVVHTDQVGSLSTKKIEEADIKVAQALGKRVAEISRKLSS